MKVKNEMIEFVSGNFEVIKNNFYNDELNILEEIYEDEGDIDDHNMLVEFLNNQMNISTAEELIEVINERSLGVDFEDDEDTNELFKMIKVIKEKVK
jgi:RecJ-like exonuclease